MRDAAGNAQARAPGARRQGAVHRLRRCRPRGGGARARSSAPSSTAARTAPPRRASTSSAAIHDAFLERFAEQGRRASASATRSTPSTDLGPLIQPPRSSASHGFVDARRAAGARIVRRRRRTCPDGPAAPSTARRSSPACAQDSEIVQHEVFGPVLVSCSLRHRRRGARAGQRHALRAGRLGLDARRLPRAARGPRARGRHASGSTSTSPIGSEMPHGGVKQSGFGKDMSMYALEEYTAIKHVIFELTGAPRKHWYDAVSTPEPTRRRRRHPSRERDASASARRRRRRPHALDRARRASTRCSARRAAARRRRCA